MNKKIINFFWKSLTSVIVICIVLFCFLLFYMSSRTNETIYDVGGNYMSAINEQVQQKFSAIIDMKLIQIENAVTHVANDRGESREEQIDGLIHSAQIINLDYLGIYGENGEYDKIYGKGISTVIGDNMSINADGNIVTRGFDENGNSMLLLGRRSDFPMSNGKPGIAMIAALPMEQLNEALFLKENVDEMYSHIVNKNGDFVIRNGDAFKDNYLDRIEGSFETYKGKAPSDYRKEIEEAIERGEDYSTTFKIDGEIRLLYCSKLYQTEDWYLLTVMPEKVLSANITRLDHMRIAVMISILAIILALMTGILLWYYRLSQKQFRELEAARREAMIANKAKSEFLSSMSHDIRTPMNAIIGMTEIALKNTKDIFRVEECLHKIKLSSKHLLGLINDVLDMSKIESHKMTLSLAPISLKEIMDDIVTIMQPQVKAREQYFDIFIKDIIAEEVLCDGVRLNQVLLNLLSNAVKFTPEKGRIDVYMWQEASLKGDKYVRTYFKVSDSGIGMSEEFQQKIFDSFSREETEQVHRTTGTGLGMAITKSIVDLMGGSIELQSEKGTGTTFHITVDFEKAEIDDQNMKLPAWNVLVVDDNEQLCASAVANLKELGVNAEWTTDGAKAVDMVEERHWAKDDYHFALIDWKMPGMDGIAVIHEMRRRVGTDIPVFLISAYDWSEMEDLASAEMFEGFIAKPLFKSTLYACLSQYMEGYSPEEASEEEDESALVGKKILLAEDIEINWEVAEAILGEFGMELEWAVNGKECVDKFVASEVGYYDAILMDIRMPFMNGYEATREIRSLDRADKDLPIIAMTADAFSGDVQKSIESGMNAHIAKPIDVKECIRTLKEYIQ